MPLFSFFLHTASDKLKKNADKGYAKESIEIGYRYLNGCDGLDKSATEALRYLKPIVETEKSEYLKVATQLYIEALLIKHEESGKSDSEEFEKAIILLNHLVENGSFKMTEKEVYHFFNLLKKSCQNSRKYEPIENYLKYCIWKKDSHEAYFCLANLYATGESNFPKKPKKAILYYLKLLFVSSERGYGEESVCGKTRAEYFNYILKKFPEQKCLGDWCISALPFVTDYSRGKIEAIFQSELIKPYFKMNLSNGTISMGSTTIDLSYVYSLNTFADNERNRNECNKFLQMSLKHDPYTTIEMLVYAYKDNFLNETLFCEFLDKILKNKKEFSIPESQVDKLRLSFFAIKYKKEVKAKDRFSVLIELAKVINLVSNTKINDKKSLLISELIMELLVTDHIDCIAQAEKLYNQYGEILNRFQQFKESGLKVILTNKQNRVYQAKFQLIAENFDTFYVVLQDYVSRQQSIGLLVPQVVNNLYSKLKNPLIFLSHVSDEMFDQKKFGLLIEDINSLKSDIKLMKDMVTHLDIFKERLDNQKMGNLMKEIDLMKEVIQDYQKLMNSIEDFQKNLHRLKDGERKNELTRFLNNEVEIPEQILKIELLKQ